MSWQTVKLANAATRIGGGTPSRKIKDYWGGEIPWFTVADLKDLEDIQKLSSSREAITQKGLEKSAAKLVPAGAVVFSSRVVVGKVGIAENELATNQDFSSFIPSSEFDTEFLAYFLIKSKMDLRDYQRGATIKGVTTKFLENLDVPKAPITEQRRIVARIKKCMERVEEIDWLTSEQSKAASQVLRAARREFLGGPLDMPPGWREVRLDQLASVIYGISAAISKNKDPNIGSPIVRMANISIDGQLDLSDLRYCPIPKGKKEHFALKPGDLLLNWRSGSAEHVGKTALFMEEGLYSCASFILRIRSYSDVSNNRFLRHVLNFMRAEGMFAGQSRMQINHKLNAKEFSVFPIRIPPRVTEQEIISEQLDAIEAYSVQVRTKLTEKVREVKTLRESILRKAFSGEL